MPDWSYPKVKAQFDNDALIIKPGFCRLSLAFFMSDEEASGFTMPSREIILGLLPVGRCDAKLCNV